MWSQGLVAEPVSSLESGGASHPPVARDQYEQVSSAGLLFASTKALVLALNEASSARRRSFKKAGAPRPPLRFYVMTREGKCSVMCMLLSACLRYCLLKECSLLAKRIGAFCSVFWSVMIYF